MDNHRTLVFSLDLPISHPGLDHNEQKHKIRQLQPLGRLSYLLPILSEAMSESLCLL